MTFCPQSIEGIILRISQQVEEGTGDDEDGGGKTNWLLDVGGAPDGDWRGFLRDSEETAGPSGAAAAAISPLSPMSRVKKRSLVNKLDELQSRGMCSPVQQRVS